MTETPIISGRRARHSAVPEQADAGADSVATHTDPSPVPTPTDTRPAVGWWQGMRGDAAARKARGGGRRWLMRWMREQPTSVADHLDYYLRQRDQRPDRRHGWGLTTVSPLVNGVHAALYVAYGVTIGLVATLVCYALAWIAQRPGRTLLLVVALVIVDINLSTWLAGS